MKVWLGFFVILGACGGAGLPDIVDRNELFGAMGRPSISRVRDAGNSRLPPGGAWSGAGDGVASPGELVVIEGNNFGHLPTVQIGGRAATVLARTSGGGIVTRVPVGVPSGSVAAAVSHLKGRAEKMLTVRRLAVALHDGKLHVLEVEKAGLRPLAALPVAGARALELSPDGAAAYLLTNTGVAVVDLTAPGGARLVRPQRLQHRTDMLTSAMDAPRTIVVGGGVMTLLSTELSSAPRPYDPLALPKELDGVSAIELSPDGKTLAALVPDGNRLVALDVSNPRVVRVLASVDLLPSERLPLVRDLAFSSDGETLWVVSGDNAKSLPAVSPTRLTAVRILIRPEEPPPQGEQMLSVWRTQTVPGAAAPLKVAVARGQPVASGTTIRTPPEKAAVFVSAIGDALFKLGEGRLEARTVEKLWRPGRPGQIVRADVSGGGGPLFTMPQLPAGLDLTPDAQLIVAAAARVATPPATDEVVAEFGLLISPLWGETTPVFLGLAPLQTSALKPPFDLGDVRIQP